MRRGYLPVCVVLAVVMLASTVMAQPRLKGMKRPAAKVQTTKLTDEFKQALAAQNRETAEINSAASSFQELPTDLQETILLHLDKERAAEQYLPKAMLPHLYRQARIVKPDAHVLKRPGVILFILSDVYPFEGTPPDTYAFAGGAGLNSNCEVIFNGAAVPTVFLDYETVAGWSNSLVFRVPQSTPLAHDYPVKVRNTGTNRETGTVNYRICAPRGYRGYHGWQFSNFGDPQIPWDCYRDFFGRDAVEYADGSHRPLAQVWYDVIYSGVGAGGNCYGMAVSSLRSKRNAVTTLYHGWFAANQQDFTWLYP